MAPENKDWFDELASSVDYADPDTVLKDEDDWDLVVKNLPDSFVDGFSLPSSTESGFQSTSSSFLTSSTASKTTNIAAETHANGGPMLIVSVDFVNGHSAVVSDPQFNPPQSNLPPTTGYLRIFGYVFSGEKVMVRATNFHPTENGTMTRFLEIFRRFRWIEIPQDAVWLELWQRQSNCEFELSCTFEKITAAKSCCYQLCIMSLDIKFDAANVIEINCAVKKLGDDQPCLKTSYRVGAKLFEKSDVIYFDSKADFLSAFKNFVCKQDPDIIIGNDIKTRGLPAIINNAAALTARDKQNAQTALGPGAVRHVPYFSRLKQTAVTLTESTKSAIRRSNPQCVGNVFGRIVLDTADLYINFRLDPPAPRYAENACMPLKLLDYMEQTSKCQEEAQSKDMFPLLWLVNNALETQTEIKMRKLMKEVKKGEAVSLV